MLTSKTGIGPVIAAVVYTAWSYPSRVRSEAAFAAQAGVNPIPASFRDTTRHRLNRGGDRRLNRTLHVAVVTRMTHDPVARASRLPPRRTTHHPRRSGGASSATSPASSTGTSKTSTPSQTPSRELLDRHRRVHRPHSAIGKRSSINKLDDLVGHHS